jgi:hypothetical protein
MTTFMWGVSLLDRGTNGDAGPLKQGYLVSGLALDPPGEFQFQEDGNHDRRRQLALSDEFVNRQW